MALSDQLTEGVETVTLRLTSPAGATLGNPNLAIINVADKPVTETVPTAPSDLVFQTTRASTGLLKWPDNSTNETSFVAYYSFDGVTFSSFASTQSNQTQMAISDLTPRCGLPLPGDCEE